MQLSRESQGGTVLRVSKQEPSEEHTNNIYKPKGGVKDVFLS